MMYESGLHANVRANARTFYHKAPYNMCLPSCFGVHYLCSDACGPCLQWEAPDNAQDNRNPERKCARNGAHEHKKSYSGRVLSLLLKFCVESFPVAIDMASVI